MFENTRGGLIPYVIRGDQIYICLMLPSNEEFGGSDYQLAKGHREEGETDKECAVREAIEELGLIKENLEQPWHINDLKKISWWAAEYKDFNLDDHSDETKDAKWFKLGDAFNDIREWQRSILGKFIWKLRDKHPGDRLV